MSFESWENMKINNDAAAKGYDCCECGSCQECHSFHRENNEPHLHGRNQCSYCLDDGYCQLCQSFKDNCEEWYHPIREAMIMAAKNFKSREEVCKWLETNKWMEDMKKAI